MRIITYTRHQRYGTFLGWATAGTIWLTVIYKIIGSSSEMGYGKMDFTMFYYIANCILLFLMFYLIKAKYFTTYSFVSCILLLSVITSLFIGEGLAYSLFAQTAGLGVVFGAYYGGFIFVPMFLAAVFISGLRGTQYFLKKIDYEKYPTIK